MKQRHRLQLAAKRARLLLLGLLAAYGLLLALVMLTPASMADVPLTQWVQRYRHPALLAVAQVIDEIGKPYFVLLKAGIPAVLLVFYGYRREAAYLTATLLADAGNLIIKRLANRTRPENGLVEVLEEAGNQGFPSGHTVNFIVYFGFWLVLLPLFPKLQPRLRRLVTGCFLLLILLSPWARVYMGLHWPSDVIGGGFFGIIVLAMLCFSYFLERPDLHS